MEEVAVPDMFSFEEYNLLNCNALYFRGTGCIPFDPKMKVIYSPNCQGLSKLRSTANQKTILFIVASVRTANTIYVKLV